jgi:sugar phosphate isomerase/epimerase
LRARLGINAGFAINRFPEPEEWLRIAGEDLGLRHAQFVADLLSPFLPDHIIDAQIARLRAASERFGVHIGTTFTSAFTRVNHLLHPDPAAREAWFEWWKRWIVIAARLGAKATGGHFGILSVRDCADPQRRRERVREGVESWKRLGEVAAGQGLEYLMFEPMSIPREMAETIEATAALLSEFRDGMAIPMRLCLDVDHGDVSSPNPRDTDPYEWLREFGAVSPCVHIKQSSADKSAHWPFTADNNAKGIIRPQKVLSTLGESGASDVTLLLEISHREREPFESRVLPDLRESVAYWRPFVPE